MMTKRSSPHRRFAVQTAATAAALVALLMGCAADPSFISKASKTATTIEEQATEASTRIGARVSFHYADYYSITAPHPQNKCAGDIKTFYDQFTVTTQTSTEASTWTKLAEDASNSEETTKPAFIKNVSVDLTDSNAAVTQNEAYGCSYGNSDLAPPVSSCSTFDYGAIGGIPTTMGGTLLLIGGVQGYNYSGFTTIGTDPFQGTTVSCGPAKSPGSLTAPVGYTECDSAFYALAVQSLPSNAAGTSLAPGITSATGRISTWSNVAGVQGYTGPKGAAGASATYNEKLQQLLVFGGAAPLAAMGSTGPGAATYDSWIYDLQSQKWTKSAGTANVAATMQIQYDYDGTSLYQFAKGIPPLALFGYAPVQGMGVNAMSTGGAINGFPTTAATILTSDQVDHTDRVAIVGGLTSLSTASHTSYVFNPTYGPELRDRLGYYALGPAANTETTGVVQWLESYHTQVLDNTYSNSRYYPDYAATGSTASDEPFGMGLVALRNNTATQSGAGYLAAVGGFDLGAFGSRNEGSNNNANCLTAGNPATGNFVNICGTFLLKHRFASTVDSVETLKAENSVSNFSLVTNVPTFGPSTSALQKTAPLWNQISEGAAFSVPSLGGATLIKGMDASKNDVLFYGGTDCSDYMVPKTSGLPSGGAGNACQFHGNAYNAVYTGGAGKVWQVGAKPTAIIGSTPTESGITVSVAAGATNPLSIAGMASARGLDSSGNVLIVSFGGVKYPGGTSISAQYLYYIGQINFAAPDYTLKSATPTNYLAGPEPFSNATIVYSHVTHKFYLYGGYNPDTLTTNSDVWELSVSGDCSTTSTGTCSFTWNKLAPSCYPATCPGPRRSHRMVEVNYFDRNPGGATGAGNAAFTGENDCTNSKMPCSFGIFMEGGTADGTNFLNDRWMFDPTGNGGQGHWQKMGELPPRVLASMTNVSYQLPTSGNYVHRAVMFGGETGLANPALGASGNYFVPPTLGDTWMYDYASSAWHRVTLLGKGYAAAGDVTALSSTFEKRQAFVASNVGNVSKTAGLFSDYRVLTPPPLAGAVMVTRTHRKANHLAEDSALPLKIPEVYLFGGRTKDGGYHKLSSVYKFCAGSTGEKLSVVGSDAVTNLPTLPTKADGSNSDDDATCDAYDADTNPSSQSPTAGYVGRWLYKQPNSGAGITADNLGAYLAAGAYDPIHDLILFSGGLRSTSAADSYRQGVTDLTNRATNTMGVFEYTPATKVRASTRTEGQGEWNYIPSCSGFTTPTGRYGHSMSYDTLNHQVIVVGGYDAFGEPLTYTHTYENGGTQTFPEVWSGYRVDKSGGVAPDGTTVSVGPFPCYYWKQVTVFGNNYTGTSSLDPPNAGIAHAASVFVPSSGYNTGFYSLFDNACAKSGPVASASADISKLKAGGVYFDLDRTALGAEENLLLNLTYIPLGPENQRPDALQFTAAEQTYFKIHLVKTNLPRDSIRQIIQPRHLTYSATDQYPELVQSLSVISTPTGEPRQEQIVIPLSANLSVDRIRIERYSGSAILIDASLYRMGQK